MHPMVITRPKIGYSVLQSSNAMRTLRSILPKNKKNKNTKLKNKFCYPLITVCPVTIKARRQEQDGSQDATLELGKCGGVRCAATSNLTRGKRYLNRIL